MWILFALLSALFSSVMAIMMKISLKGLSSEVGLLVRTIIVTIICLINVIMIGKLKEIKNTDSKIWLWIVLCSFATYFTWFFYFKAMESGNSLNVVAVSQISIIFTMILNLLFLKEKIYIFDIIGSVIVILGVYLITYK